MSEYELPLNSLRFCQKEKGLNVCAYVIMPSHIHLLVQTDNSSGLSPVIQSLKSFTAKEILKYLKDKSQPESRREWILNRFAFNARKNKSHGEYKVWKRDNHPVILYTPKAIRKNLDYIHLNPVAAGFVGYRRGGS